MAMDFLLLGPFEARVDGQKVPIGRRRERCLLAVLLLEANRLVPTDRLVALLWDTEPPAAARRAVHAHAARLRSALRPYPTAPRLVSKRVGYLVEVSTSSVDAHRFRAMVERASRAGDGDDRAALYRDALDLWRGPLMADVATIALRDRVGRNLDELRLRAIESWLGGELDRGRHREVLPDLADATAAHPENEQLAALYMLALHRSGRTIEAGDHYARVRRHMVETSGIDPSPDLRDLHAAILRADAAVLLGAAPGATPAARRYGSRTTTAHAMPGPVADFGKGSAGPAASIPHTLPAAPLDFTGRVKEVGELVDVLRRRAGQGLRIAGVTGPGGVGKTALCLQVAHRLREEFPDGQLYVDMRAMEDGAPVTAHVALGRFLRAWGMERPPESAEARVDRYRSLLDGRRVLVVLDNAAGAEQVAPLIPGTASCAVLVNSRARLSSLVGAHAINLPVLARDEGITLLSRIAGPERVGVEPDAADTLIQLCGDLPLAIRVVGARLAAKPHWSLARMVDRLADERERLRQLAFGQLDVRSSLALSYAGLTDPARRLLCRLGDLGLSEVNVWTAAALLDQPVTDAEEVLEDLFDAQLLDVAGREVTGHTRYRLHDLVRLAAGEYATADEDAAALAAARERAFGAWLHVTEAARQRMVGGAGLAVHGDAPRWPVDTTLVDRLIAAPLAWIDVERQSVVGVVRRAAETGALEAAWDLACTASVLFQHGSLYDDCQSALAAADPVLQQPGLDRGQAFLLYREGHRLLDATEREPARKKLQRAKALFEQIGDRHGQGLCLVTLGFVERWSGNSAPALEHHQDALAHLRSARDLLAQSLALRSIGQVYMQLGQLDEADDNITAALHAARKTGSVRAEAQVLQWLGELRLQQGRYDEAEPLFRAVVDYGRSGGETFATALGLVGLAGYHRATGDPQQATLTLHDALRHLREENPSQAKLYRRVQALLAGHDDPFMAGWQKGTKATESQILRNY